MKSAKLNNTTPDFLSVQEQDKRNKELLIKFIESSGYFDRAEQRKLCERFGLPFDIRHKRLFATEYEKRFVKLMQGEPITCAKAEQLTGIHQKYLTTLVGKYKKKNVLWVVYYGRCDVGESTGVQFITMNKKYKPKFAPSKHTGSNQTEINFSEDD